MVATSVTLHEVLTAARVRAASLVPETSGYLALAIADASARLPFRIEDRMVSLSTEGTVAVKRGAEVVEPEESALVLRDSLGRLLSLSIGSAPSLAAAARARARGDGVEAFIHELETALVPVNRAAARRALARLARETVRAREAGKLKGRANALANTGTARRLPPRAAAEELVTHAAVVSRSDPPVHRALPTTDPVGSGRPPRFALPPTPVADVDIDVDFDAPDETPRDLEPPVVLAGEAATALDTELAERILFQEPMQHTELGGSSRSDVDELLARFEISDRAESAKVAIATPRSIAKLAGIDLSPLPPVARPPVDRPTKVQGASDDGGEFVLVVRRRRDSTPEIALDQEGARRSRWPFAVMATLGLVVVAGLGHLSAGRW
jgi:hypothetical protein